jgi:hypothetical protein
MHYSFAVGTVVVPNPEDEDHTFPTPNPAGQLVITEVSASGGSLEYAINGNVWFTHESVVFVSEATPETLEYVFDLDEDGEEDEEDEDEDEVDDDDLGDDDGP